jgi:uncharacterized membrane protein YbhN (UPF0104 family)
MVEYFAPVPGSMGVTEAVTSYLIDPAMTEPGMAASVLLRLLCWYLTIAPGIVFLAWAFRRPRTPSYDAQAAG